MSIKLARERPMGWLSLLHGRPARAGGGSWPTSYMTSNLAVPEQRNSHSFVRICRKSDAPPVCLQVDASVGEAHEASADQVAADSGEPESSGLDDPDSTTGNSGHSAGNVVQLFQGLTRDARVHLLPSSIVIPAQARRMVRAPSACDPRSQLEFIPSYASLPEAVRGLCYRKGQTFGIELELAPRVGPIPAEDSAEWRRVANAIATALKHELPLGTFGGVYAEYLGCERSGGKSAAHWNVEFDDTTGWEVTTRVLTGLEGYCEVVQGCRALARVARELDLVVDVRTGTHVHFGFGAGIAELKQALGLVRLFEPALGSLVAPSRIAHLHDGRYDVSAPNPYCRPVSTVIDAAALERIALFSDVSRLTRGEDELRYVTFNLRPLDHQQTVEVRLHHGTLDAHQILLWVSLWQQLLWAAEHPQAPLPKSADLHVIDPSSDLLALAREHLPSIEYEGQRAFLAKVRQRRSQVVDQHWKRTPDLASWVHKSSGWE